MIVVANIFGEATQQFPADLVVDIQLKLNTISEEEADRLKRAISKTPEELCSLIAELYSKSGIKTIERLSERDGPARLSTLLPSRFVGWLDLDSQLSAMRACELIGLYFLHINRIAEAL
ncbi:hypothetical protein KKC97_04470, partial [bacterium]|nr:hypothetical protein [bacterium]